MNQHKKVLHLTIKKKWFDLILSGEKKEEYREIKPYWNRIFSSLWCKANKCKNGTPIKDFDIVEFRNGYGKNVPTIKVECLFICRERGLETWGAEKDKIYYVISLGKILSTNNI
jgi:hypothetical protein